MDELEAIWIQFLSELQSKEAIENTERKMIAGTPFLYVVLKTSLNQHELEKLIRNAAKKAMAGKRVTVQTIYVREQANTIVFRHRFFVPQEKMFCCGNLCEDCILLRHLKNRSKKDRG
ncbi:hypothetical protein [Metabacillus sp. RGM 3146]|uniref:hypothetical protein n=1 Tax=Metabacillus sp. RGM 3146 TaxID=3401092 RepID=UPI003B994F1B